MSKRDRQLSRRERKQTERPAAVAVSSGPPASPVRPTAQRSKAKPVLFFATPTHRGSVDVEYLSSMLLVGAYLTKREIEWLHSHTGNSEVAFGRDLLALRFLESEATHLIFIDDDQAFDVHTVLRLLELDKDVVAAHTAKKSINWPMVRVGVSAGLSDSDLAASAGFPMPVVPVLVNGQPRKERGAVQVKHIGTGLMCIKRHVIERLHAKHPELTYTNNPGLPPGTPCVGIFAQTVEDGIRWSEDYAFCRRAAAAGFELWLDYSCPIPHVGRHIFYTPPLDDVRVDEHGAVTMSACFPVADESGSSAT